MELSLIICLCFYLLCRRRNNHFDVQFRRTGPYLFLSKYGKDAVRDGKNGRKGVYFSPESASFPLINNLIEVFFPICTMIWRVNNYVSRQGGGTNRRNESTIIIMKYCVFGVLYFSLTITFFDCLYCWNFISQI